MVCVYALAEVKQGCEENFQKAAQVLINYSRAESGNISYHLGKEAAGHYVFLELWRSEEDLQQHLQTPHFLQAGAALEPILKRPLQIHKADGVF